MRTAGKALSLDGFWELSWQAGGGGLPERGTLPGRVPGDVHGDLVAAGLLPDPRIGLHSKAHLPVETMDFTYRRSFACRGRPDRAELVFDGLDGLAEIRLDGQPIGRTANAFVPHRWDVTRSIHSGTDHQVVVQINPGVAWAAAQDGRDYRSVFAPERIWLRKPQYGFGWDWAPRLVSCGIWRSVRLELFRGACIRDYRISHEPAGGRPERACLPVTVQVELDCFREGRYTVRFELGRTASAEKTVALPEGRSAIELALSVPQPRLWYPAGYGRPALYPVRISVGDGDRELHRLAAEHGFRTVTLDQSPIGGRSRRFQLVVNGVPLFARGANWVPPELLPAWVTAGKQRALLQEAFRCNMNMLRVWGGGFYESDEFYRACSRLGILIWQDFMFSCAEYPDDRPWFAEEARREAEAVLRHLRRQACLALLCGNNENHWIYGSRGPGPEGPPPSFPGRRIYEEILPDLCRRLAPEVPYRPSSPFGGEFPNCDEEGDKHSWSVTMLSKIDRERSDVRRYRLEEAKFVSEYGVLSCALPRSLREAVGEEGADPRSAACRFHDNSANDGKIDGYLRVGFGRVPADAERYTWESLAYQAIGYREAIAAHRRRLHGCSGSLFWMYSDCWGTHGWSIIDYYLRRKPSWYWVRRAYAPVAVFSAVEDQKAAVWVVNDTRRDLVEAELRVETGGPAARRRGCFARRITVPAGTTVPGCTLYGVAGWISVELYVAGRLRAEDTTLTHHPGEMPIGACRIEAVRAPQDGPDASIRVRADGFAHLVRLDLPDLADPEDNYFNLLPGRERTVRVRSIGGRPIRVSALNAEAWIEV